MSSSYKGQGGRKSTNNQQEQVQPQKQQQKKSLQNLLVKLSEVQGNSPQKGQPFTHEPQMMPTLPG